VSKLYHDAGPAPAGQKVLLATTAYESPDVSYTFSIQNSRQRLSEAGIPSGYLILSGNCHVDDARNIVVQEFLLSDCTDLIFLDADVSWDAKQLVELCGYDCDIVGGIYPFRREDAGTDMPVRMKEGVTIPVGGLLEVDGIPAGFMRIRRHVLETMSKTAHRFCNNGDRRADVAILFERYFNNGTRWGGDLNFCNKWRVTGGRVHAAYEMTLGHTARMIIRDSLGAALRRQSGTTLKHICGQVRKGTNDIGLLSEARKFVGNKFGAFEDVLILAILLARKANGPILEAGSGLSTILMAAATDQMVYCLEHDEKWLHQTESLAIAAGVENITPVLCPIVDGWYDVRGMFPTEHFALGLNDGPPRQISNRMGFFEHFGNRCSTIIADDCDNKTYADQVEDWALANGKTVDFVGERAALMRPMEKERAVA